ncbi:MAG: hypothetical protein F4W90_03715 [Gammaproteobacteria bacterium]|nr:hypothetical protein [Gammaproteobacteria bacterium]
MRLLRIRRLFRWTLVSGGLLYLVIIGIADTAHANQSNAILGEQPNPHAHIDEIVVEGERIDPTSMALQLMEVIYYHKERAAHNFKIGRYKKSFPDLLRLAKMGFKDSQARVSYIYQYGLGDQPRSAARALAWLGVAVDGTTRPQYRNRFKRMMAEVPDEHVANINDLVDNYRTNYSSDTRGITCMRSRTGHLDKFTCLFSQQRNKHIDRLMMLAKTGEVPWVLNSAAIDTSIALKREETHWPEN